jgi:hypothetical protein
VNDNEGGVEIDDKWNDYNPTGWEAIAGIGYNGSIGMQASWDNEDIGAGHFSIGIGNVPSNKNYWAHNIAVPGNKLQEVWVRQYVKFGAPFNTQEDGIHGKKFFRVRVLSDPRSGAEQTALCTAVDIPFGCCTGDQVSNPACPGDTANVTAYQGILWPQVNTNTGSLFFNSSDGVEGTTVVDTGNNCNGASVCPLRRWMPRVRGDDPYWEDWPSGSGWMCIEAHIELNTLGNADGTEEFWIDGVEEGTGLHDQNMRESYNTYGINQIVFDNYWNDGSVGYNEIFRDNFVIATEPIGCLGQPIVPPPSQTEGVKFGAGVGMN